MSLHNSTDNSSQNGSPDILEKATGGFLKGKNRLRQTWIHDVAQRMKIRRHSLARDAGLDESYDVGPAWPQSEKERVTEIHHGGGALQGALIAAAMMATGAGGMAWVQSLMNTPAAAPTRPEKDQTPRPQKPNDRIFDYKIKPEVIEPGSPPRS